MVELSKITKMKKKIELNSINNFNNLFKGMDFIDHANQACQLLRSCKLYTSVGILISLMQTCPSGCSVENRVTGQTCFDQIINKVVSNLS